jgi:hypothetical protein
MTGSFLKLQVKGQQDKYLTKNWTRNFFENKYENHCDFAVERIKTYFIEDANFGKKITLTFPRRADLLSKVYFYFKLPALTKIDGSYAGWTNNLGHSIIDYVELEIGTRTISKYYGLYIDIWEELTSENNFENSLLGKYSNADQLKISGNADSKYLVKLPFWFCKGISSALPLFLLDYHQVRVIIKLKPFSDCVIYDGTVQPLPVKMEDAYLLCDYIFIEDALKAKMKAYSHTILIEQLQYKDTQGDDTNNSIGVFKTDLPFNHPVSEILWVFIEEASMANNDWFNFSKRNITPSTKVYSIMKNAKLSIDGKDYTEKTDELIFRSSNDHKNNTDRHIYSIPFCLYPEISEPSGSLNFSKLDSVELYGDLRTPTPNNRLYIFARNHNWLTIQNGMSSLLFIS